MTIRVLHIITGLSTGGAENMLLKIISNRDRENFSPYVISLTNKGEIGRKIESQGVPVFNLDMSLSISIFLKLYRLIKLVRWIRPNVVQTWMYHADLLGGLVAKLFGRDSIKLVWGVRQGNLSPDLNKRSTLTVVRICGFLSCWLPDRIVCCSRNAFAEHTKVGYGSSKLVIIPNGFDLNRFRPNPQARVGLCKELGLIDDVFLVAFVGRDDPQKNIEGFLRVAAIVKDRIQNVAFVMVGSGMNPSHPRLTKLIADYELGKHVYLLDKREDLPDLMAAFDILVSTSFGEAFPNVIGEAMACGTPCVVTNVGESKEIVGNTGKAVESGDMKQLAEKVVDFMNLPGPVRAGMGMDARHRVRQNYRLERVVKMYDELYASLIGNCK